MRTLAATILLLLAASCAPAESPDQANKSSSRYSDGPTVRAEPAPAGADASLQGRWRLRAFQGAPAPQGEPPVEIVITADSISANACVFSGWRYRQDGPLVQVTPIDAAICERTVSRFEQQFSDFMREVSRATVGQDGSLILNSAAERVEFERIG